MAVFGMCGDRLDHLIPMEPEAYGCCGHSMVVSLRSGVVPVWPAQDRIVQALCSLLSSQGDPEQSASRTLGHPSFLHPGRKTQIHFRHTQPRLRGRATFLLTAATLEWITKPIGVAQKGACWLLLSKWRHLLAFVRVGNSFSWSSPIAVACFGAMCSPCWLLILFHLITPTATSSTPTWLPT